MVEALLGAGADEQVPDFLLEQIFFTENTGAAGCGGRPAGALFLAKTNIFY